MDEEVEGLRVKSEYYNKLGGLANAQWKRILLARWKTELVSIDRSSASSQTPPGILCSALSVTVKKTTAKLN